jgi:hypothetical protein
MIRRKIERYLPKRIDVSMCNFDLVEDEGEEKFFFFVDVPPSAVKTVW